MVKINKSDVKHFPFRGRHLRAAAALGVLAISLAGCVVYPDRGYGGGYYAAPVVAPTVVVGGGWGWGWRGGGWGRWR